MPAKITCVSGLCIDLPVWNTYNQTLSGARVIFSSGPDIDLQVGFNPEFGVGSIQMPTTMWLSYRPIIDGYQYDIWGPAASFTLANVTETRLSEVPLPAGGALLLSGLFLLILRRRWGSQGLATHLS